MYIKYSTGLLDEIITITIGFYMQSQWERAKFMAENMENIQELILETLRDSSLSSPLFPFLMILLAQLCFLLHGYASKPYLFSSVFLYQTHTQFWVLTCHRCCELALYLDTFSKLGQSYLQFQESCLQFQVSSCQFT